MIAFLSTEALQLSAQITYLRFQLQETTIARYCDALAASGYERQLRCAVPKSAMLCLRHLGDLLGLAARVGVEALDLFIQFLGATCNMSVTAPSLGVTSRLALAASGDQ